MANILLYETTDDKRKVSKTLSNVITLTDVIFKQPFDILNPVIIATYQNTIPAKNYCYLSNIARFYFIDKIVLLSGGRCEIYCSIDVLQTYDSQIRNLTAILVRSETSGTTQITDTNYPLQKSKTVKVYEFSGGDFNIDTATNTSYNFILNVMGGGANNAG